MNISYIKGNEELLDSIKELWENLNLVHCEKSTYFKEQFKNSKFAQRKNGLLSKAHNGSLYVVLAQNENHESIGYSVSSFGDQTAEIESIYIEPSYRKHGIGGQLMQMTLKWIKEKHPKRILVSVAVGNEEAIGFYQKFGLYPRRTELQMNQDFIV